MSKKVLGKRLREEEKDVKTAVKNTLKQMLSSAHTAKGSPYQMMKLAELMQARAHNSIDLGYIKTLLYPELYNSDLPQPLSTQSYTRFTDKKEISFKSSIDASNQGFLLVWYPKTVIGPQMFIRYGNLDTAVTFELPAAADNAKWKAMGSYDYSPFFSQANLVAASISIQYIGQLQLEQGYMVGSQIYGINPSAMTADDVENGQFRVMAKPGDGLRAIYIPKDLSDFQYYPITKNGTGADGKIVRAKNAGNRPEGETTVLTGAAFNIDGNWVGPRLKPAFGGTSCSITYSLDGDAVVFYVKGMSVPTSEDIRIDIVRKFNGFPQSAYRDILDLTKPKKIFDPKKTMDVIQELQTAIPQLCGHSLKQMDRVSDQIQEFIPNIGHLYDEGLLKEGTSLEGFATQLQTIAGNEGFAMPVPGRIYE